MSDSRGKNIAWGFGAELPALGGAPAPMAPALASAMPMAPEPLYKSGVALEAHRSAPELVMRSAALEKGSAFPDLGSMMPLTMKSMSLGSLKPMEKATPMPMDVDVLGDWVPPPPACEEILGVQDLPHNAVPHQCVTVSAAPEEVLAVLPSVVVRAVPEVHLDELAGDVFAVKGQVVVAHHTAGFAMDVYAHQNGTAVEFRCTMGDRPAWHDFFMAAAVQLREQYPSAAMLGGWHGEYPSPPSGEEIPAPLAPLEDTVDSAVTLTPASVDEVDRELKAHGQFSGEAIESLARAVDDAEVGAVMALANAQLLLSHAHIVDTLIQRVLEFKHDAPAQRGALFVLHRCCEDVAQQRRFLGQPLEIMAKLLPLLDGNHIVVQNTLRLMSRLAPAVVTSDLHGSMDGSSGAAQKWRTAIAAACRNMAKYAQGDDSLVTEEMLAAVRRLVPAY